MIPNDVWKDKRSGKIYGYCGCGREVQNDKNTQCPVCGSKLEWNEVKKVEKII